MSEKLCYKQSGVDTKVAADLVQDIGAHVLRTQKQRQLYGNFGLFAAAYDLSNYKEPVIVTGCDGIGTKLDLLLEKNLLETAGKDLVAMSVNDILTTGGEPLLFLDYIGIATLDKQLITRLITGMCDYLEACGCILAGGETAEMPGTVPEGLLELSGFCIGCAEKSELIKPTSIQAGDVIIGYKSDGPHANGWSLIRCIIKEHPDLFSKEEIRELLRPTRLYYDVVRDIKNTGVRPRAMAHITGGGLPENLERILQNHGAHIAIPKWDNLAMQKLFKYIKKEDKFHVFNMGIGWVAIVHPDDVEKILTAGPGGIVLGEVSKKIGIKIAEI